MEVGKVYLVKWADITLAPAELDLGERMPSLIYNVMGKVIYDNETSIELIWCWGEGHDTFTDKVDFMNRMTIPKGCILEVVELKKIKEGT